MLSGLFGLLFFLALICCGVFAVMAVFKKLKKNPAKKSLQLAGISFLVAFISIIVVGVTSPNEPVSVQGNGNMVTTAKKSPDVTSEPTTAPTEAAFGTVVTTEAPATSTQASTENPKTTPTPASKYTGDTLKSVLSSYIKSKKDADKNKLKESDPDELYSLILSILKNQYSPYVLSVNSSNNSFDKACSDYIDAYSDIFNDNSNSTNLLNLQTIREMVRQAYNGNNEKSTLRTKYGSEEYLQDFRYSYMPMDFYVLNALTFNYTDSVTAKLLKKFNIYGDTSSKAFAATSDSVYNSLIGYMPGETYCVIQPIDEYEFSKQGMYTLNVIEEGETELEDERGFKTKAPIYIEVSDGYIESVNNDVNRYFELSDDITVADYIVRSLIGIPETQSINDFSDYYGYYQCNKYTTELTGFGLSLEIDNKIADGTFYYNFDTTSCTADFKGELKNNKISSTFEDSFGGKGTFTLTLYDYYALLDLKYNDIDGQFPEGINVMMIQAN